MMHDDDGLENGPGGGRGVRRRKEDGKKTERRRKEDGKKKERRRKETM
jgi:hypothetical protein